MALTQDSFRGMPRKLWAVKALSGFFCEGRVVEAGEVLQLPRGLAQELVHANKVVRVEMPLPTAESVVAPAVNQTGAKSAKEK